MGVPPWEILQHSNLVRQEGGWMPGLSSLRPPPMPVAWRWGELPKPELSEHHQLRSLLCHPLVYTWGLSHPPPPPTTQDSRRQLDSDPPNHDLEVLWVGQSRVGSYRFLDCSRCPRCPLGTGARAPHLGEQTEQRSQGKGWELPHQPPPRQAEGCESIRLSE